MHFNEMIMHGPGVMDYNPSFVISNSPSIALLYKSANLQFADLVFCTVLCLLANVWPGSLVQLVNPITDAHPGF